MNTKSSRSRDDRVLDAIEDGHTQIVNLGAGLDPLAARLHGDHPDLTFIELDREGGVVDRKAWAHSQGGSAGGGSAAG